MAPEVRIEHRYPEAGEFLRRHGSDALAVLHDLAVHAERRDDRLVVQASVREIASRLTFLSKDSVHRRLRDLHRAGVILVLPVQHAFEPPTYVVQLDGTGISVASARPRTA